MKILLLGDVHVSRPEWSPRGLLSKRLLGQINQILSRDKWFNHALLDDLVKRMAGERADVLLCTGDLTTTALAGEFEEAARALGPLLTTCEAVVVAGNHDRYTGQSMRERVMQRSFGKWMAGELPHHRRLGEGVELIALDASRPTGLHAGSELPRSQVEGLRRLLAATGSDATVIVMMHYPIGTPPGYVPESKGHGLRNAGEVMGVLGESGRRAVYVHGHVHVPWCWRPVGAGNVVVVNAGSPLHMGHGYGAGQGYWVMDLSGGSMALRHVRPVAGGGWREVAIEVPKEAGGVAEMQVGSPGGPGSP